MIGFYGTGPEYRGLAVDEIQKTLDEAEQKALSKQDGLSFVQERKHYDSYFADRAQKQRLCGVIEEGLSTERPEFELGGSTDYRAMVIECISKQVDKKEQVWTLNLCSSIFS